MVQKRKKINIRDRMYATNDLIVKWLTKHGHRNFKIFRHGLGNKDYYINGCGFDSISFKDSTLWMIQHKTNCRCPKKELEVYKEIEKSHDIKCGWANWNKDKRQLEYWTTTHTDGLIMNKENPTSLKP